MNHTFFAAICLGILICWWPPYLAIAILHTAIFLLGIVWLTLARKPVEYTFLFLPLAAIILWGVIQELTNQTVYRFQTWLAILYWAANATAFFLAVQLFRAPGQRERFLRLLVYFAFGVSLISITQYFTSPGKIYWLFPTKYGHVLGPFIYKNQYAAFIELILPIALYYSRRSIFHAAAAAVMFATVMASLSRAGAVLVLAELVILIRVRDRKKLALVMALCLIFTAVAGWTLTWARFFDREPLDLRVQFLRSSWQMLRDRPWTGFGLGTWRTAYPAYARIDNGLIANRAHSDWMEWAVEGGLPFLGLMATIFVWTAPRAIRSVWGIGLLAVFLHSLVDYPAREPALAVLLFALLGLLAASERERLS